MRLKELYPQLAQHSQVCRRVGSLRDDLTLHLLGQAYHRPHHCAAIRVAADALYEEGMRKAGLPE